MAATKTKRPRVIKTAASAAMAQMQATPWAIHPPALAQIASALEVIAATGQPLCRIVESSAGLDLKLLVAGPVDAAAIVPPAAGTPSAVVNAAEYSRKVQRSGNVAVIPVVGVIEPEQGIYSQYLGGTACSQLRSDLRISATDPSVREIWMVIDSPGGSAMGLAETARVIAEVAGKKPVVAYCRNLCASAAYFLASQATRIVATESTLVGSVGTIIDHMSYAGWLEQMGLKNTPITFGKNKGEGSPYRDLSTSAREGLQATVDAFGKQFVAAVAKGRKTTPENVMERYGQGRVFIASEAMERGMIDGIGLVEESSSAGGGAGVQASVVSQVSAAMFASPPTPTNQSGPASLPAGSSQKTEPPKVKKLTALMFGLGMVQTLEASAESVDAAITSFCFARGVDVPRGENGQLDETRCIALLNSAKPAAAGQPTQPANSQNAGGQQTQSPAAADPASDFRNRGNEIRAIATSMNAGRSTPVITAEQITDAVLSDKPLSKIREEWTQALEQSETGTPPVGSLQISGGRSGEEAFATGAVNALLSRMGHKAAGAVPPDMRSLSLFDIGLRSAAVTGLRLSGNREDQALAILQQDAGVTVLGSDSGAYNRPGSFPNILSNLVGKILDTSMELAESTYPLWTQRMLDVPDFKPKTVLASNVFDSMDELPDGDDPKELRMAEELMGWFQASMFANTVKLTPVMMANDDLDAFNQSLLSLGMAHDLTLNGLCLQLLAGNVTLVDGVAMFHSSRNNLVSGVGNVGAPSATTARANRLLHRGQTAVGSTRTLNSYPRVVLVPYNLEDAAKQTYYTITELTQMAGGESKQAVTDATINVHRGTASVVVEPGLDSFSNTAWYTFDTKLRTIVHGFQSGYGRGGRRTSWFEPGSGCRYIKLEGRFGAAAVGFRGAVRNPGA